MSFHADLKALQEYYEKDKMSYIQGKRTFLLSFTFFEFSFFVPN